MFSFREAGYCSTKMLGRQVPERPRSLLSTIPNSESKRQAMYFLMYFRDAG